MPNIRLKLNESSAECALVSLWEEEKSGERLFIFDLITAMFVMNEVALTAVEVGAGSNKFYYEEKPGIDATFGAGTLGQLKAWFENRYGAIIIPHP